MASSVPVSTLERFTTFGDLLRFLRRRVSITQVELATAVGYSDAQISRLEQNLRLPDIPTIEARFVSALGLENEPKAVARLLDLAANVRREDAPAVGICPYKGLSYFDEGDADLFSGREALTSRLAERVLALAVAQSADASRLLAVIGASGCGKSSLIRAGLVPALRWNKTSVDWPIHTITPTASPLESLAASFTTSVSAMAGLMDDLARDPRALHLFVKQGTEPGAGSRLLIIIDQFEELFTLCRSEERRTAFIDNLLAASSEPAGRTISVIALRADFYAHCAAYPDLREVLARQQEYIGAMDDVELRRAIEEPARRGRWESEPGLVDLLLHDVGHEPGALPLLSHALLETWQRRRGHIMTLSGYTSSGGVRGAIAETAESVFMDQFTPEQQRIARRIFLRLTELGEETATGDTRRRVTVAELTLRPDEASKIGVVLKTLADARLITTGEDSVEVAHEALIREWPRLRSWLEDNRESLRFHHHLTEAAQEWAASNRGPDLLYRGARLTQAREWALAYSDEMNELERAFVDASQACAEREAAEREAQRDRELQAAQKLAEEHRRRAEEQASYASHLRARNRLVTAIGGVALILALVAGWFGLQADANARQARADFSRAESLRLAAEADALLSENGDPQTAALLSIRALQTGYSFQADSTLSESMEHLYYRQLYRGHTGWIYAVAFIPDGGYVLTGSQDGTARLWDTHTGQELRRFVGHQGGISSVAFSPDGKYVLTAGNDRTMRLWDSQTGRQLRVITRGAAGISSVAFSPDGQYVLIAGGANAASLWDVEAGESIRLFTGHRDFVSDAVFSPDGRYVLTGSRDRTARLWDAATGENLHIFTAIGRIIGVAFSPDGKYMLTGSDDHAAQLWALDSGHPVCTFAGHTDAVNDVAFSPDGRYVLTGSDDHTARVWDTKTCQEVRRFAGSEAAVKSVAFSPDGQYALVGGLDNIARLWVAPASVPLRTFVSHTPTKNEPLSMDSAPSGRNVSTSDGVSSVTFSPDGEYVLAGSEDRIARLWEAENARNVRAFIGHTDTVTSVAFSPDGKYVLTGSNDRTARLWDAATGRQLHLFAGSVAGVASVAFSPDGRYILTTGIGGNNFARLTVLWDAQTGQTVRTFNISATLMRGRYLSALAFSPDGKYVLIQSYNGASLLETATGRAVRDFLGYGGYVRSLAFSPDGKYVLTGNDDKTARLWDAATGELLRVFEHTSGMVLSVAFSPDGKTVLTGLSDNTAHLWDVATGEELRLLTGHLGQINSVAFSPDGKWALTGSQDGTARIWDTDVHETVMFVCSLLWRDLTSIERTRFGIRDSTPTCPTP